jgi:hypothetical protein
VNYTDFTEGCQVKERTVERKYIRPQTVAEMYDMSVESVYKAVRSGELVARKMSPRVWLITPADAEKWVNDKIAAMEQAG